MRNAHILSFIGALFRLGRVAPPAQGAPVIWEKGGSTGAGPMMWLDRQGSIRPSGSRAGTANPAGATWEARFGDTGWNAISYVRTSPDGSSQVPNGHTCA
ncbi:hypothetical protein [Nonomuraea sp. NPDC049309]|uniref:GH12 family glycosyl hydrolase domain-containing protein n=1 Tax=Nonomuraea sp. NPDC049309 TaxID=3364350 RepID=UPI003715B09D